MQIKFYYTESDDKKISKKLTNEVTRNVNFKEDSSIISPSIYINKGDIDISKYNYCHIKYLNRYYFIRNIIMKNSTTIQIDLEVDPLMSNKELILNTRTYIDRCGDKAFANVFLNDTLLPVSTKRKIYSLSFGSMFNSKLYNYITVVGGSNSQGGVTNG